MIVADSARMARTARSSPTRHIAFAARPVRICSRMPYRSARLMRSSHSLTVARPAQQARHSAADSFSRAIRCLPSAANCRARAAGPAIASASCPRSNARSLCGRICSRTADPPAVTVSGSGAPGRASAHQAVSPRSNAGWQADAPPLVALEATRGHRTLLVGLRGPVGVLSYVDLDSGDGGFVSRGTNPGAATPPYVYFGSWTGFEDNAEIPAQQARAAARQFLRTEDRPTCVRWHD